jgi:hypothetical protein
MMGDEERNASFLTLPPPEGVCQTLRNESDRIAI